jgi:DNA-binding CsgD family transcriptional regulator
LRIYVDLTSARNSIRATGIATLTVRENQILDLLRRRYSNKEIANHFGISESTVKFHVSNVLTKLNVNDRRDVKDKKYLSSRNLLLSGMAYRHLSCGHEDHRHTSITVQSEKLIAQINPGKSKTG